MHSTTVTRFAGLDERTAEVDNLSVSPNMSNLRITDSGALQKRPGITTVFTSEDTIDGMWAGYLDNVYYFCIIKDSCLFLLDPETGTTSIIGDVGAGKCVTFEFGGKLYIMNGDKYSVFNGANVHAVNGYTPLVALSCSPSGEGTLFEAVNLLTPLRRQLFSGDGTAVYKLAESNITLVSSVKIDGVSTLNYSENAAAGTVTFISGHEPPSGLNNVEIIYSKNGNDRTRISNCRFSMLFGGNVDGRLFLWGNPDFPNYRFHSELADGMPSAEYFTENGFTVIGNTEITDIVAQYDRQLIFTSDRAFYSLCELRQDSSGNLISSFPVYNLNGEKGNLIKGAGCIIDNNPVTLCPDGLNYWVSTSVSNEKNAVCFSAPITNTVLATIAGGNNDALRLYDFQPRSELLFVANGKVSIYNYRLKLWYRYTGFTPDRMIDVGGVLYFSQGGSICKLDESATDDDESAINCYWVSPLCAFDEPDILKDLTRISFSMLTKSYTKLIVTPYDNNDLGAPIEKVISTQSAKRLTISLRGGRRRASLCGVILNGTAVGSDLCITSMTFRIRKTKGITKNVF